MTAIASNAKAIRDTVTVFWLKGVQFVPHYKNKGVYVAPGGIERSIADLVNAGAVKSHDYLWPRHYPKKKSL